MQQYRCQDCGKVFIPINNVEPHQEFSSSRFGSLVGCPICAKAAAMPKTCPQCSSLNVFLDIKMPTFPNIK